MKTITVLALLIVFAGLTGCTYEKRDVVGYEPGVYKGAHDPLLAKQQNQELINRFKMVQTDR